MENNSGAINALLGEYKRAIDDLCKVIKNISTNGLGNVVDHKTSDPDCKSVQSILSHVVQSGYTYVIEIRKWKGGDIKYKKKELLQTSGEYCEALDLMFDFTELLFEDYPNISLENYKCEDKMKMRWGQMYDVDQLMEHAIVHILRHRRQVENFKLKL